MIYTHEREREKAPVIHSPMPKASGGGDQAAVDQYLASRTLSSALAKRNGWYASKDAGDTNLRVVIPATNSRRYNYWQARAIDAHVNIRYQSPRCARTDSIIVVYPDQALVSSVIVTEGPMDALAAASFGFRAVAVMGNTPPPAVLDFLVKEVPGSRYLIVADLDASSEAASTAFYISREHGLRAFVLSTYPVKDLAAASLHERKRILAAYV